jgi:hypothetical protein
MMRENVILSYSVPSRTISARHTAYRLQAIKEGKEVQLKKDRFTGKNTTPYHSSPLAVEWSPVNTATPSTVHSLFHNSTTNNRTRSIFKSQQNCKIVQKLSKHFLPAPKPIPPLPNPFRSLNRATKPVQSSSHVHSIAIFLLSLSCSLAICLPSSILQLWLSWSLKDPQSWSSLRTGLHDWSGPVMSPDGSRIGVDRCRSLPVMH